MPTYTHPVLTGIVLLIFAIMAFPPMLSLARERRFFLAGLMFVTFGVFLASGIISFTVDPIVNP
ncbi:hypothetical protein [Effusibacillus lacus]|uniref:Uncharacterized protein n=1 Tax=Effusibacillus lacus TaxID=1348429 RepID=A0A292YIR9_9BACL|nr:hypothetical protein [Effusibacillus lacus]TCS74476.1 hypothetical protein EDD64_11378 [Effusibacillus lacus]GAX88653.1 hypothetical protein EFBL_0265 [Effusibacillus lacus]